MPCSAGLTVPSGRSSSGLPEQGKIKEASQSLQCVIVQMLWWVALAGDSRCLDLLSRNLQLDCCGAEVVYHAVWPDIVLQGLQWADPQAHLSSRTSPERRQRSEVSARHMSGSIWPCGSLRI